MEAANLVPGVEESAVRVRVKWDDIPTLVLRKIGGAIQGIEDYVRFASVCKSWHSCLFCSRWECPESSKRRLEYPWLMLVSEEEIEEAEALAEEEALIQAEVEALALGLAPAQEEEDDDDDDDDDEDDDEEEEDKEEEDKEEEEAEFVRKRGFYSLYSGKRFYLDLPESYRRACYGSSCGWLLTLGLDLEMHLLNPITRKQLPLPSQTTFTHQYHDHLSAPGRLRSCFIYKFLVTCDEPVANTEDHRGTPLVFVIYGQYRLLAMARPGDNSWTPLPHTSLDRGFFDFSSFRDQVIVYNYKRILRCHLSALPPRFEDVCAPPLQGHNNYVVHLGGELHILCCFQKASPERRRRIWGLRGRCSITKYFKAFKRNFVMGTWEEVDTLGGWAVFVGRNSTFALSSSDYPQCRPNCIYFTDQRMTNFIICGGCDWGIYHYEKRSKEFVGEEYPDNPDEITLNPFPISQQASKYSPLLWVAPNLW